MCPGVVWWNTPVAELDIIRILLRLKDSDRLITGPQQIVDMFNTFYIETVEELKSGNIPRKSRSNLQHNVTYNQNTMFISAVMQQEVTSVVHKLKNSQSAGFYEILELVLNSNVLNLKGPLTHIFNSSFQTGCFPQLLKIAKVRPSLKKGDIHDIKNYIDAYQSR
jgi:hypothetical protein